MAGIALLRLLAPAIEFSCGLLNCNSMDADDGAVLVDLGLDLGCGLTSCSMASVDALA